MTLRIHIKNENTTGSPYHARVTVTDRAAGTPRFGMVATGEVTVLPPGVGADFGLTDLRDLKVEEFKVEQAAVTPPGS